MRTFSNLVKAALSGQMVVQRYIVRVTLPGPVTWGASDAPDWFTWDNGSGPVLFHPLAGGLKITFPAGQAQLANDPVVINVSATDPEILADFFDNDYRGATTDIALLLFDPTTGNPGEEVLRWRGPMDTAEIIYQPRKFKSDKPQQATLQLTVASRAVDMKRSRGRYGSDVDQRLYRDASDGGFKDMALAGVSMINFGQSGASSPAGLTGAAISPPSPSATGGVIGVFGSIIKGIL